MNARETLHTAAGASRPASGTWYLSGIHMESYGSFYNRSVGPFGPGLNVAYGKNEAGKTTVASFIQGVLFGWTPARGKQNAYRPANAGRAGQLIFENAAGEQAQVQRVRNADGLQGDAWLTSDIDADTYHSLFALDSDELRGLDNASTVTARLLTAGAGTDDSPANVRAELDRQLASYTSRAASNEHSLTNLAAAIKEADEKVAAATTDAEHLMQCEEESHMLQHKREESAERLARLNAAIEQMTSQQALLENLERRRDDLLSQCAELEDSLDEATRERESLDRTLPQETAELRALDRAQERTIRDTLDDLQKERDRAEQNLNSAQADYANSKSRYDALQEDDVFLKAAEQLRRKHRLQAVLSLLVPAICLVLGIPMTLHGLDIGSLAITSFGIALVVAAVLVAAAAAVALIRPDHTDDVVQQRRQDTHWVMLQDKKRCEACEEELHKCDGQIEAYLGFNHLSEASGSLRRARELLDAANRERAQMNALIQKEQSIRAQRDAAEQSVSAIQDQADAVLAESGAADDVALDEMLRDFIDRRNSLMEEQEELSHRAGELSQRLSQARSETDFARLKQHAADLRTRFAESKQNYARLLLARRYLQSAIEAWEGESQPAVYAQAGNVLSDMTGGAWRRVRLSSSGELEVFDAEGRGRSPHLLSLGTCQQLYLSLRIALLMTADRVGRNVPVLADDILVNFDDERREMAARALLSLARQRQVILFTCHSEVVALIQRLAADANIVAL